MWSRILRSVNRLYSATEFGCNIGLNLLAIKKINSHIKLNGYEINAKAVEAANKLNIGKIFKKSIIEKISSEKVDLTFTVGVLIHINPDYLENVYENLVNCSKRYILIAEYYNPTPIKIKYRGFEDRLFKRDFAGELIEKYGLNLIDYGFIYRIDNVAPQDDISWFLLEK